MPVTVSHAPARTVHSYTIPSSSGASYLPTRSTAEASPPKVADNPVTSIYGAVACQRVAAQVMLGTCGAHERC